MRETPAERASIMRQAIVTKYIGPTNTRGSRIKATADAGSITVPFNYRLKTFEENHRAAAVALQNKFNWQGNLIGGSLPACSKHCYAFVIVD
jgi:hypothetical protein